MEVETFDCAIMSQPTTCSQLCALHLNNTTQIDTIVLQSNLNQGFYGRDAEVSVCDSNITNNSGWLDVGR